MCRVIQVLYSILATGILVTCPLLFKSFLRKKSVIYNKWPIEYLEVACHVNIIWLCLASYHTMGTGDGQFTVSSISGSVTFTLFIMVISYHVIVELFCKSNFCRNIKQLKEKFNYIGNKGGLTPLNKNDLAATFSKADPPTHMEIHLSCLIHDSDKDNCIETPSTNNESKVNDKLSEGQKNIHSF